MPKGPIYRGAYGKNTILRDPTMRWTIVKKSFYTHRLMEKKIKPSSGQKSDSSQQSKFKYQILLPANTLR